MNDRLQELIDQAQARYDALTPEQKAEHDQAQRESFARGMMPAGYNMPDDKIRDRIAEIEKLLPECGPGAAVNEMNEERSELLDRLRR